LLGKLDKFDKFDKLDKLNKLFDTGNSGLLRLASRRRIVA